MGDDDMIYICAKCKFLFERKNEPSKCPSCENQYVVGANSNEREAFRQLIDNQRETPDHSDTVVRET